MKSPNKNYLLLLLSVLTAQAAGAIGSYFTFPNISSWYNLLHKPTFSPPNWLFGPVWTLLYTLMGIAAWLIWNQHKKKNTATAIALYGFQLALNLLWSIVFFGWHNITGGLMVIALLWLMILATIIEFWKLSRPAAYLLIPYLAWVSFASLLNFALWQLN